MTTRRLNRRGFSHLELLCSVVLLVFAALGAFATWQLSVRAPASKRITEMAIYVGTREVERMKAHKYLGLADTPDASPVVRYYDKDGNEAGAALAEGYMTKAWVQKAVDRDNTTNSEDLRHIRVEVYNSAGTGTPYETVRTLTSFGGV